MAIQTEYSQEKELDDALAKILSETPELASVNNHCKVVACFSIKTNDNEENVPTKGAKISLRKVSPAVQVFLKPKADFMLVVDYFFWTNATETEKRGKLIRTLTRIGVENTNNGIKLSIRPWDIQENIAAIKACGVFDEESSRAKEAYDLVRVQRETAQTLVDNMQKAEAEKAEPKAKGKGKVKPDDDDEPPMRPARKPPVDEPEPEPEPE
jgi:hypothetical protein